MKQLARFTAITLLTTLACTTPTSSGSRVSADTGRSDLSGMETAGPKIFGRRLSITGDFDGNGKPDTVFESYISALTGKETFKVLDANDAEANYELKVLNKPICRIYSDLNRSESFVLTTNPNQTGIALLQNLGDLNNDKGDELGYFMDWSDESSLNTYHILTLGKTGKWKELFSFPIHEMENFQTENLFQGKHIVRKTGPNTIEYKFYGDSAFFEVGRKMFQ